MSILHYFVASYEQRKGIGEISLVNEGNRRDNMYGQTSEEKKGPGDNNIITKDGMEDDNVRRES